MLNLCKKNDCPVVLCGDFNAYTSSHDDFVDIDDLTCDVLDIDQFTKDELNVGHLLERNKFSKQRCSIDKHKVNNY